MFFKKALMHHPFTTSLDITSTNLNDGRASNLPEATALLFEKRSKPLLAEKCQLPMKLLKP
jgi:hypothetical protein